MMVDESVLLHCGCHDLPVSLPAPSFDGEKYSLTCVRFNRPDSDVHHRLVAKGGVWVVEGDR